MGRLVFRTRPAANVGEVFSVGGIREAGIGFKVIAGWVGHKDGGVLVAKTYGHLRDEHSTLMATRMTFDATVKNA